MVLPNEETVQPWPRSREYDEQGDENGLYDRHNRIREFWQRYRFGTFGRRTSVDLGQRALSCEHDDEGGR
jgi:hypothetical protein